MATRYLIGRGELLTYPIDAPKKKVGDKAHPYTLAEAQQVIIPEIEAANTVFESLPAKACPDDLAVASLVLHPAYLAKSYFPKMLLDQAGLASVGSRTRRIKPRRTVGKQSTPEADTTELFVAGPRAAMQRLPVLARSLTQEMPLAEQFIRIEAFGAVTPAERLHLTAESLGVVFEVGLHLPPETTAAELRAYFADYAKDCGFQVNADFEFEAGRLLFVAVEGESAGLESLALFTLVRVEAWGQV